MMTTTSEMKNSRDLKKAPISAPPQQALRPDIHHDDKQQQRGNGPVGGRNQIGGEGFEITDNECGDQRTGYAAKPTQHHEREGARRKRSYAVGADAEKHSEQHACDTRENAVD